MADGSLIQNLDIETVPSIRRNPAIADLFQRLDFAERQGSGLRKIREETERLFGYTDDYAPKFVSTASAFHVILKNMNYNLHGSTVQVTTQVTTQVGMLLSRVEGEMTRQAIQDALGLTNREHFRKTYLVPALEQGVIEMTLPDKPNSRSQRYRLTALGQRWLDAPAGGAS